MAGIEDEIGQYFLQVWRDRTVTEKNEEIPSSLVTWKNIDSFAFVDRQEMSVTYRPFDVSKLDVGVVRGNCPAPSKGHVYFFEAKINQIDDKLIAIGFTPPDFPPGKHPGEEMHSFGYLSSGFIHSGSAIKPEISCPGFTIGDTVGAGINYVTQELFFTKNEDLVGSFSKVLKHPMFPTVSVHSPSHEVTVNFGQFHRHPGEDSFLFDLMGYINESKRSEELKIDKFLVSEDVGDVIIRTYLQHYGYGETLKWLDKEELWMGMEEDAHYEEEENAMNALECSINKFWALSVGKEVDAPYEEEEKTMYALERRTTLRQLIMAGDIDQTLTKLGEWYPELSKVHSTVFFLLHIQNFIEHVKNLRVEEAVSYGRIHIDSFKRFDDIIKECYALLAYKDEDEDAPQYVKNLYDGSQRELVADAVNAMVLFTSLNLEDSMQSRLENLIRQLGVCKGEAFNLGKILKLV